MLTKNKKKSTFWKTRRFLMAYESCGRQRHAQAAYMAKQDTSEHTTVDTQPDRCLEDEAHEEGLRVVHADGDGKGIEVGHKYVLRDAKEMRQSRS